MPDLRGRVAVVTGANGGLGYQTSLALAGRGADVVLACRDPVRGQAASDRIAEQLPGAHVELRRLDLADLASIREFASSFVDDRSRLDILVNNAGVMALPYRTTADGFEMHMGTNHLGHFALTGLLLRSLLRSSSPRVVTVGSTAAIIGRIRFDDLQSQHRYRKWLAYGQSKLANLLFAFELDRRSRAKGLPLISVAAHPGYATTNLYTTGPVMEGRRLTEKMMTIAGRFFAQSDAQGALPIIYGASVADLRGGEYLGPDRLFGFRGYPTEVRPPAASRDPDAARRLWEVSMQLTGVRFEELDGTT